MTLPQIVGVNSYSILPLLFLQTDWCQQLRMATTAPLPLPQRRSRRLRGQKPLSPSRRQVEEEWSGASPTPPRGGRPFQGLRPLPISNGILPLLPLGPCQWLNVQTFFDSDSLYLELPEFMYLHRYTYFLVLNGQTHVLSRCQHYLLLPVVGMVVVFCILHMCNVN